METGKVLEYFYNLILFTPDYPKEERNDHTVNSDRRYVPYESIFGGESEGGYDIYIGKTETGDLRSEFLSYQIKEPSVTTYLAMIKTDKRGYYIKDSFYICPAVFALAKIIKENNPDSSLDINLINKANDEFDKFLVGFDRKLEYKELNEVFNYVTNKLNLGEMIPEFSALVKARSLVESNENDGYLRDIENILISGRLSQNLDQTIRSVGKVMKNASVISGDMTPEKIRELSHPDKEPLGIWSERHGNLNTQLTVNSMTNDMNEGIRYFRNLKDKDEATGVILDVLVSNTIEKALALSRYNDPDEAFTEVRFNKNKEVSTVFYSMDEKLRNYCLFMAGHKRDALKDLKFEVDKVFNRIDQKPFFSVYDTPEILFELTSNRSVFDYIDNVYRLKDKGLKVQLNSAPEDYDRIRAEFRKALDNVIKKREQIKTDYSVAHSINELEKRVSYTDSRKEELRGRLDSSEAAMNYKESELRKKKFDLEAFEKEISIQNDNVGFFKKLLPFFFNEDPEVIKLKEMEEKRENMKKDAEETNRDLNRIKNEFLNLNDDVKMNEEEYELKKQTLQSSKDRIEELKTIYGDGFTEEETFMDLSVKPLSESGEIWKDEEYDRLRSELFYVALRLIRTFVLRSRNLKTDISLFIALMEGKMPEEDMKKSFRYLLSAMSLVYPLTYISTEYAPYILSLTGNESFENLIIRDSNEHELLRSSGLLWRFRKISALNSGERIKAQAVPEYIKRNLSKKLLSESDPSVYDVTLSEIFDVL